MSEKRVIKKYPNRRLYDTVESKYITLEDLRDLILEGVDFCVTDQKTGEDITRCVLLQIILEQENSHTPIFTTDALVRIIRFYGDSVQELAAEFLERSLSMFTEQQKLFHSRLREVVKNNPLTAITELTQRNLRLWKNMQDSFFKATGISVGDDSDLESHQDTGSPNPKEELPSSKPPHQ